MYFCISAPVTGRLSYIVQVEYGVHVVFSDYAGMGEGGGGEVPNVTHSGHS